MGGGGEREAVIICALFRAQKLNKEQEAELASKNECIIQLEAELKKKKKELDVQKQRVTELTEIMDRQVRDKSRPAEHRQGTHLVTLLPLSNKLSVCVCICESFFIAGFCNARTSKGGNCVCVCVCMSLIILITCTCIDEYANYACMHVHICN